MKEMLDTEFVLVECVQSYRTRYIIEVPKGKPEWALDTVALNEGKEFSQKDIGEQIVSHRPVSTLEILELCDQDNAYAEPWNEELQLIDEISGLLDEMYDLEYAIISGR